MRLRWDISPMKEETFKSLGNKRILFFKSHVSAYTTKKGTFVPAHSDKRIKKYAASGDDRTADMFVRPPMQIPKRDIPVEVLMRPEDYTPDLFSGETKADALVRVRKHHLDMHEQHKVAEKDHWDRLATMPRRDDADDKACGAQYAAAESHNSAAKEHFDTAESIRINRLPDEIDSRARMASKRSKYAQEHTENARKLYDADPDYPSYRDMEVMITVAADSIDKLRKVDVLRGLKENVIIGRLIPTSPIKDETPSEEREEEEDERRD